MASPALWTAALIPAWNPAAIGATIRQKTNGEPQYPVLTTATTSRTSSATILVDDAGRSPVAGRSPGATRSLDRAVHQMALARRTRPHTSTWPTRGPRKTARRNPTASVPQRTAETRDDPAVKGRLALQRRSWRSGRPRGPGR